ncbi:MAG TPA: hypothetical protein VFV38_13015 [Ktedonobacteraceae bacterium]|nr:hypothetical protein [Ktedonobacteraceae bacterium]
MSKSLADAPARLDEQLNAPTTGQLQALKKKQSAVFWPWLGGLLVVGLVVVVVVTFSTWNWLNNLHPGSDPGSSGTVSTLNVQRGAAYADLNFMLLNVQYAPSFRDDLIRSGVATVRVTVRVSNPTKAAISIAYYDVARLLAPKQQPIVPTNLNLTAAPQAGTTQTGWIDFPVAQNTVLNTLKFQLGNAALNEILVTIPVSGAYDASQYNPHLYNKSVTIQYSFTGWRQPTYNLYYHLTSVDVRSAYNGVEARAGQQFYVLNFAVDNPNNAVISPGPGYYYMRLAFNGSNHLPKESTIPDTFKANAHGVSGRVVFMERAGMRTLNIFFLFEAYAGGFNTPVSL